MPLPPCEGMMRRQLSVNQDLLFARDFILDFPISIIERSNFLLFISHLVYSILLWQFKLRETSVINLTCYVWGQLSQCPIIIWLQRASSSSLLLLLLLPLLLLLLLSLLWARYCVEAPFINMITFTPINEPMRKYNPHLSGMETEAQTC